MKFSVIVTGCFWKLYFKFHEKNQNWQTNIAFLLCLLFCFAEFITMNSLGLYVYFQISHIPFFTSKPVLCRVMGILQHYFWLTSFLIMTSIALDLCYRFSNIYQPWYVKKSKCTAVKYCWVVGIIMMSIPTCLDCLTDLAIDYAPHYGICFIGPQLYLISFFIGPAMFLFFINMFCFIATVISINGAQPADSDIAASTDRNMMVIFARIGGLMGVTWLFALVPYVTGIEELWYVFVITNGLQGMYIFLSSGIFGILKNMRPFQSVSNIQSDVTRQETTRNNSNDIDEGRMWGAHHVKCQYDIKYKHWLLTQAMNWIQA